MNIHELSDLDADALTITTRGPYTWVTCTADGEEVTVGPVPTRKLTGALPRYSDDMDGGVTCALIEKEAEESPSVDYEAMWWVAERRAEQAEKERDEALRLAKDAMGDLDEQLRHRATCGDCAQPRPLDSEVADEEWLDARYEAALDQVGGDKAAHLDPMTIFMIGAKWDRQYAEPRPLAPEDITGEMVQRALKSWRARSGAARVPDTVRDMLVAALTEPPQRPEWADLADEIDEATVGPGVIDGDTLAQRLHKRGVRVVTEEQP